MSFGERWQDALAREFTEELGPAAAVQSEPLVIENIFSREGAPGYEVVFMGRIVLPAGAFAGQGSIAVREDNGGPVLGSVVRPGQPRPRRWPAA